MRVHSRHEICVVLRHKGNKDVYKGEKVYRYTNTIKKTNGFLGINEILNEVELGLV